MADQKRVDEVVARVPSSESIAATRAIVEDYDGEAHEFPLSRRKVMELCDNIEAMRAALRESQRRVEVLEDWVERFADAYDHDGGQGLSSEFQQYAAWLAQNGRDISAGILKGGA